MFPGRYRASSKTQELSGNKILRVLSLVAVRRGNECLINTFYSNLLALMLRSNKPLQWTCFKHNWLLIFIEKLLTNLLSNMEKALLHEFEITNFCCILMYLHEKICKKLKMCTYLIFAYTALQFMPITLSILIAVNYSIYKVIVEHNTCKSSGLEKISIKKNCRYRNLSQTQNHECGNHLIDNLINHSILFFLFFICSV